MMELLLIFTTGVSIGVLIILTLATEVLKRIVGIDLSGCLIYLVLFFLFSACSLWLLAAG